MNDYTIFIERATIANGKSSLILATPFDSNDINNLEQSLSASYAVVPSSRFHQLSRSTISTHDIILFLSKTIPTAQSRSLSKKAILTTNLNFIQTKVPPTHNPMSTRRLASLRSILSAQGTKFSSYRPTLPTKRFQLPKKILPQPRRIQKLVKVLPTRTSIIFSSKNLPLKKSQRFSIKVLPTKNSRLNRQLFPNAYLDKSSENRAKVYIQETQSSEWLPIDFDGTVVGCPTLKGTFVVTEIINDGFKAFAYFPPFDKPITDGWMLRLKFNVPLKVVTSNYVSYFKCSSNRKMYCYFPKYLLHTIEKNEVSFIYNL